MKTLNAVNSANHFIIESPLLDFTLAPSLPFLHRLLTESTFPNRAIYQKWIGRMTDCARHGQVRLPGSGIYTRLTPVEFTTWVDDMFMGIPFLVHASRLVDDPALSRELLDDAASQTLAFNDEVWDSEAELYMHARYHGSDIKLPHWSRCNGWAIWAMSEVLLHLPDSHPKHAGILSHFRRFARSVARFQEPSGFWPNVLDHPGSRDEVSGTAIFTMSIARGVNHGWLDADEFAEVATAGWEALESAIDDDGTVHHICEGTMCSEYAFGINPNNPDPAGLFSFQILDDFLTLAFPRIADPMLSYHVEASSTLAADDWTEIWQSTGAANIAGMVSVADIQNIKDLNWPRRFLRLRVSIP